MNKRKPEMERRIYTCGPLEVRAVEGQPTELHGYAAVFDEMSEDLGGFREKVAPGAFSDTIGDDVRALFNHDSNLILGRTKSRTLRLQEDSRGLSVQIQPPDTTAARDLIESVQRGDVDQMSFGFRTIDDHWDDVEGQGLVRTLMKVRLFDVSPVVFPAYPQTEIALRSMEQWKAEHMPPPPDFANERRKLDLLGL